MATRLPAPQRKVGILGEIPEPCLYRKMFGIPAAGRSAFGCLTGGPADRCATTQQYHDQPDDRDGADPPRRSEDDRRVKDHEKARKVRGSSER